MSRKSLQMLKILAANPETLEIACTSGDHGKSKIFLAKFHIVVSHLVQLIDLDAGWPPEPSI